MISDDWWIEEGAQYDLPFITMISGASFLIITLMTWLSLFGYLAAQGYLWAQIVEVVLGIISVIAVIATVTFILCEIFDLDF
jgi:hypothetical protein